MEINLYWKSLKNEIDAETWKSAKCYITEDKAEERAEAQTGNEVLDTNYCFRKIEQGLMNLQDLAHRFMTDVKGYVCFSSEGKQWADVKAGDIIKNGKNDKVKFRAEVTKVDSGETSEPYAIISLDNGNCIRYAPESEEWKRLTYIVGSKTEYISPSLDTDAFTPISIADRSNSDNAMRSKVLMWKVMLAFGDRQNVNARLLASAFHKLCVLNVLQEWSKITLPALTQEYQTRLAAEEVRIKQITYRKEEPDWDE